MIETVITNSTEMDSSMVSYILNISGIILSPIIIVFIGILMYYVLRIIFLAVKKVGAPNGEFCGFDAHNIIMSFIIFYSILVMFLIYYYYYDFNPTITIEVMIFVVSAIISSSLAFSYVIKGFVYKLKDKTAFIDGKCYLLVMRGSWVNKGVAVISLPSVKDGFKSFKLKHYEKPLHIRWEHMSDYNHMNITEKKVKHFFKLSDDDQRKYFKRQIFY